MHFWDSLFASVVVAAVALMGGVVRCDFELLILHTSDMHSRFDETDAAGSPLGIADNTLDRYGGFARLKNAVTEARQEARNERVPSIFLNAGDTFQGTAFYAIFKAEVVSALLPLLDIEVMSLGNHEFDSGVTPLAGFLKNMSIPVVDCNLDMSEEHELAQLPNLHKSIVLKKGGQKIGITGYLTLITQAESDTGNVIFNDILESVKKEAKRLKKKNVHIIIVLGHAGFETEKKIAYEVPEISLVISGHTNTFLYSPPDKPPHAEKPEGPYPYIVEQPSGKKVPVISAYAYTKYLGKLWAKFDENGSFISARENSNPLLLNNNVQLDLDVQIEVMKWRSKYEQQVIKVVGRTNVNLDGLKANCKITECNLGNFVTDAYVDYVAEQFNGQQGWTDAPIAIVQSGSLRSSMVSNKTHGNLTYEEILTLLPYKLPLLKVTMLGSTLRKALEHSVSNYRPIQYMEAAPNNFLQVSGIHVIYDVQKRSYERIVKVDVRCGNCSIPQYFPLEDQEFYTILTPSFLYKGGDGYDMFKSESLHAEEIKHHHSDVPISDTDVVIEYLKKIRPCYPEISGRITILNKESPSAGSKLFISINLLQMEIILFATLLLSTSAA